MLQARLRSTWRKGVCCYGTLAARRGVKRIIRRLAATKRTQVLNPADCGTHIGMWMQTANVGSRCLTRKTGPRAMFGRFCSVSDLPGPWARWKILRRIDVPVVFFVHSLYRTTLPSLLHTEKLWPAHLLDSLRSLLWPDIQPLSYSSMSA